MLKKVLGLVLAAGLLPAAASANPFDDFKGNIRSDLLKPFALDFGGLMGAQDFHSARTLAFPGFDVGVSGAIQTRPGHDDAVLNLAGVKAFGLPLVSVSAGLPMIPLNVSVRGLSVGGASIVGAGLKYGVYKSGLLIFVPDVSVNVNYDVLSHDDFKMNHWSGGVQADFNVPIVKPFVGVGFDSTKIEVKNAAVAGLVGATDTASAMRYQIGVSISPLPLTYIYGAYNILHGETGYTVGLGIRFGGIL